MRANPQSTIVMADSIVDYSHKLTQDTAKFNDPVDDTPDGTSPADDSNKHEDHGLLIGICKGVSILLR
jgi:hypothetical protein